MLTKVGVGREQAVFEAALNWAKAQPHASPRKAAGSRGAFDGRETLLAHVRFPLMAPEALVLRVRLHPLVRQGS